MIYDITPHNFGGPLRNGDMIAALNLLEHIRSIQKDNAKFYLSDECVSPSKYCYEFRDWLLENTDYLSRTPGGGVINDVNVNLWDARAMSGDRVSIRNNIPMKKKICIFPLLDGQYNFYRNWSVAMTNDIISHCMKPEYSEYEKYICISGDAPFNLQDFKVSTNFLDNVIHITECSHYVGGDTGMSHFVSALDNNTRKINYYYGSVGLLHTTPFYALQGKGNINLFWNNYWRTDLL